MADPLDDFNRHDAEQARLEAKQPTCCICGQPIWDDTLWDFMDAIYCNDCARDRYLKWTENYIEEERQ